MKSPQINPPMPSLLVALLLALPLVASAADDDETATTVAAPDTLPVLEGSGPVDDGLLAPVSIDPAAFDSAAAVIPPPDTSSAAEPERLPEMSLFSLIDKGGVVGYLIILISVVALALIIDYLLTIRLSKILPADDLARLKSMIEKKQFDDLDRLDSNDNSFLVRVTSAGLREANLGYDAMIKAMEDTAEALASGIARKTEHLNVIGALSPMLGLLGTVLGMLQVFNEIAMTPGAIEPRQLAEGIFQALVTTCLGLIVAIPALYSYAIFRNRVDEFTGEAALAAERLIAPFKSSAG